MAGIRKFIKDLLPYQFIIRHYDSSKFVEEYLEWKKNAPTYQHVKSKYKTVISVQGFGFSGSGAVVDLMREYPCTQVLGGVDDDSVNKSRSIQFGEFDYIRHSGGLYDIERHLGYNNVFINDGVINRFIKMVYLSPIYVNFPETHKFFYSFLNEITDVEIPLLEGRYYNPHLYPCDERSSIFLLKDLTVTEYRLLCKDLLNSIFNYFYQEGKSVLVADQMCCDLEFDIDRDSQYFNNLRTIVVHRDPRDIYCYAIEKDVKWIAHDSVDNYIQWYRNMLKKFNPGKVNMLVVPFEKLLTEYDTMINKIESFTQIEAHHTDKFLNLDPRRSIKNVGIWKKSNLPQNDFIRIENELKELCYN